MPVSSSQVNQLLGQHNQMFMQQQAMAQSMSPPPVDPFQALNDRQYAGSRLTQSSLGMAGPIAQGAASIGSSAMTAVGYAGAFGFAPDFTDPFAIAFGAFGVGSRLGAAAPGLMGMGSVGTGLAFAGATGLGLFGGYMAASHAVDNIIQGVHQHSNAASMIYGAMPGAGMGMGLPGNIYTANALASSVMGSVNRGGVINSVFNHDTASSVVGMGMSAGMYQGVNSVQQFSNVSNSILANSLRTSAVFGTGIEDSFLINNQLRQQFGLTGAAAPGFMANLASHAVSSGLGISGQMGAAQAGAGMFQSMGANRTLGALYGAEVAQRVGTADASGLLGNTYELGGAQGLIGSFQSAATGMLSSRMGTNILAAAMGKDGSLDMNLAAQIAHGRMSAQEIQKLAQENLKTTSARENFALNQGELMGSFLSSFGPEGTLEAFQGMGFSDSEMMGITGLGKGELSAFRKMSTGGSRIRDKVRAAAKDGFQSGAGHRDISEILSAQVDKLVSPINEYFREIGRDISSTISETVEGMSRDLYGKRAPRMGSLGFSEARASLYAAGGYGAADALYGGIGMTAEDPTSGFMPNREGAMFGMLPAGLQHTMSGGSYDGEPMRDAMSWIGGASDVGTGLRGATALGGGKVLTGMGYMGLRAMNPAWVANYGISQLSHLGSVGTGLVGATRASTFLGTTLPARTAAMLGQRAIPIGTRFMGTIAGGRLLAGVGGAALGGAGLAMRTASRLTGGPLGFVAMELALRSDEMMGAAGTGTYGSKITGPQAEALRTAYDAGMFKDLLTTSGNRQLMDASGAISVESMIEDSTAQRLSGGLGIERRAYNSLSGLLGSYDNEDNAYLGIGPQQLYVNNERGLTSIAERLSSMENMDQLLGSLGRTDTTGVTTEARAAIAAADAATDSFSISSDSTTTDIGRFRAQREEEELQKRFGKGLSAATLEQLRFAGGSKDVMRGRSELMRLMGSGFQGMTVDDYNKGSDINAERLRSNMLSRLSRPDDPNNIDLGAMDRGISVDPGTNSAQAAVIAAEKIEAELIGGEGGDQAIGAIREAIEGLSAPELARLAKGTGRDALLDKVGEGLTGKGKEAFAAMLGGRNRKNLNEYIQSQTTSRILSSNEEEYGKKIRGRVEAYNATSARAGTFEQNIGGNLGGRDVAESFQKYANLTGGSIQAKERQLLLDEASRNMGDMSVEDLLSEGSFYMQLGKNNDDEISMIAGQMMLQRGSFKKVQRGLKANLRSEKNQKTLVAELFGQGSGVVEFLEKADAFGPNGDFSLSEQEDLRRKMRKDLIAGGSSAEVADELSRQFVLATKQITEGQLKESTLDENTPEGRAAQKALEQGRALNSAKLGSTNDDQLDTKTKVLGKTVEDLNTSLSKLATSVQNAQKTITG